MIQIQEEIKFMINESILTKNKLLETNINQIEKATQLIIDTYKNNNKILIAGNGGSAADAQHFCGEIVNRFKLERKALPAIALSTDTSVITAWSNDYNFDSVFARQIEAHGNQGDIFIGISTSGNSTNIIKAVEKAKQQNMKTILLLGKDGGQLKDLGDINIIVPSNNTPRIQEAHITVIHILCEIVEKKLFGENNA